MRYLKMFIAGLALPSFLLPFIFILSWLIANTQVFTYLFPHLIPLIWGIWNILYFEFFSTVLPGSENTKWLLTGGILGLLIAIYGVFVMNAPALIGMPTSLHYLPIIVGPIVYAILWRYVVKPLNELLGVLR